LFKADTSVGPVPESRILGLVHTSEEVDEPLSQAWSTSPGASSQSESLEGRAESRLVRQLAEIGHSV
jgi:hypothetical protein